MRLLEALKLLNDSIAPLSTQSLLIEDALGHTLSQPITAQRSLPSFDNSAMDGYAIATCDLPHYILKKEQIYAGVSDGVSIVANEAVSITTGAKIPDGCVAVVPKELAALQENRLTFKAPIKKGNAIRNSGEEIAKESLLIEANTRLNSYHIGALAAQGVTTVEVYKKPSVAILVSGDELSSSNELKEGQIFDSNSPTLKALLQALSIDSITTHYTQDSKEAFLQSIASLKQYDLIITTGGASVGAKDFTKEAFEDSGAKYLFKKIDIKPGKPVAVALKNRQVILNLPGNPAAAMVHFEIFGKEIVMLLQGIKDGLQKRKFLSVAKEDIVVRNDRDQLRFGVVNCEGFSPLKQQSPGMITPLKEANALLLTLTEEKSISRGEMVELISL